MKCEICQKEAVYKIRGEEIFYCREHAIEFFGVDCLDEIKSRIKNTEIKANKLKEKLNL
jgi:hypothetical protein